MHRRHQHHAFVHAALRHDALATSSVMRTNSCRCFVSNQRYSVMRHCRAVRLVRCDRIVAMRVEVERRGLAALQPAQAGGRDHRGVVGRQRQRGNEHRHAVAFRRARRRRAAAGCWPRRRRRCRCSARRASAPPRTCDRRATRPPRAGRTRRSRPPPGRRVGRRRSARSARSPPAPRAATSGGRRRVFKPEKLNSARCCAAGGNGEVT